MTQKQHLQNVESALGPVLDFVSGMVEGSPQELEFQGIRNQMEAALRDAIDATIEPSAPNAVKPAGHTATAGLC
jgi:hypothetical protein